MFMHISFSWTHVLIEAHSFYNESKSMPALLKIVQLYILLFQQRLGIDSQNR